MHMAVYNKVIAGTIAVATSKIRLFPPAITKKTAAQRMAVGMYMGMLKVDPIQAPTARLCIVLPNENPQIKQSMAKTVEKTGLFICFLYHVAFETGSAGQPDRFCGRSGGTFGLYSLERS